MATKLNDTQLTILTAAAGRDDRRVLPLPKLKAPPVAVHKTLSKLLVDGLIEEVPANRGDETWEPSGNTTLVITSTGLTVIGIETDVSGHKALKRATHGRVTRRGAKTAKNTVRARVGDTKQNVAITLLRRGNGASIEELIKATGWQAHSVRGFMSGALKKRLGLAVVSEKNAKTGERRYYI